MKIVQFVPVTLSIVLIAFSYFGYACAESKQCFAAPFFWDATFSFLEPLQIYMQIILIPAITIIFIREEIFQSWLRLAAWFIPISLLIIFVTPVTSNSWMPLFFVSREEMAFATGILFTAVSLILIAWKYFSFRHRV